MSKTMTAFATLIVILLWLVAILIYYSVKSDSIIFDAINTLFTGLAVVGVLFTLRLQREDIKSQNENSKIQNFENVLFRAIEYQKDLLKDLSFNLNNEYFTSFTKLLNTDIHKGIGNDRKILENNYDNCYYEYLDGLDPYFKSLDAVLELIEQSQLTEDQKDFYFKLVNTLQNREQKITLQYHSQLYVQGDASRRFKRMLYKGEFICLNGDHSKIFTDADSYFEEKRM